MTDVSVEDLLKKIPSTYKLVELASRRTFELSGGAPRLISTKLEKPLQIALEEIKEGKISYKERKEEK